jgi:hypothetical protein
MTENIGRVLLSISPSCSQQDYNFSLQVVWKVFTIRREFGVMVCNPIWAWGKSIEKVLNTQFVGVRWLQATQWGIVAIYITWGSSDDMRKKCRMSQEIMYWR